jgi:hypothetical protein
MVRHWQRIGVAVGLAGLVAGTLLGLPTGASAAPPSFGTPVTVVPAGCNFDEVTGDVKLSSDAITRGFVAFHGGSCGLEPSIRYFRQSGGGWTAVTSPYRGRVLAVAADGVSTWLLYANLGGIHLGRRTGAGAFAASRRLSTVGLSGAVHPTGDVVASGGRYWAVWSEQVGPGGEFAQTELFQALTLGQGHFHDDIARQRITFTTASDDIQPALTLDPKTSGDTARVLMIWNRNDGAQGLVSTLRVASAAFDGRWTSRQWSRTGTFAGSPDLHTIFSSKTVLAAYVAGGRIIQATNPPGTLVTNRFARAGTGPRITRSLGANFTAWTSNAQHVVLARSGAAGSIQFEVDLTPTAGQQQLIGVTARDGKATVLGASYTSDRLYSIAQR